MAAIYVLDFSRVIGEHVVGFAHNPETEHLPDLVHANVIKASGEVFERYKGRPLPLSAIGNLRADALMVQRIVSELQAILEDAASASGIPCELVVRG